MRWGGLVGAMLVVAGCNLGELVDQPRFEAYESTDFFGDGMASRPLVPGTVARDEDVNLESWVRPPLTDALMQEGQTRFDVECAHCHGRDGYGDGMVVRRGYPAPPSFHTERVRNLGDDYMFKVITDGLGKMPPYGVRVTPPQRWAIIAYVRALQLSQQARVQELPPGQAEKIEPASGAKP